MKKHITPFGTRKTGTVVEVAPGQSPTNPRITLVEADKVGYALMFTDHAIAPAKGQRVMMEFTAGGKFGGFWKIISLAVDITFTGHLPNCPQIEQDEIERALKFCHRLRDGAARMTRQQFRDSLKRSIGATKDYADANWVSFQNNPAAFLAHRNPQSQSEDLLNVILEITKPAVP